MCPTREVRVNHTNFLSKAVSDYRRLQMQVLNLTWTIKAVSVEVGDFRRIQASNLTWTIRADVSDIMCPTTEVRVNSLRKMQKNIFLSSGDLLCFAIFFRCYFSPLKDPTDN